MPSTGHNDPLIRIPRRLRSYQGDARRMRLLRLHAVRIHDHLALTSLIRDSLVLLPRHVNRLSRSVSRLHIKLLERLSVHGLGLDRLYNLPAVGLLLEVMLRVDLR